MKKVGRRTLSHTAGRQAERWMNAVSKHALNIWASMLRSVRPTDAGVPVIY